MTPTDPPGDDPTADDGPITPEVVDGGGPSSGNRRGAAARKRRGGPAGAGAGGFGGGGGGAGDVPVPDAPAVMGSGFVFRAGCILLAGFGALVLFLAAPQVADPAGTRCTAARSLIEDTIDNDDDWDDIDLPEGVTDGDDVDDLDCEEAIALADTVPVDEDDSTCGQAREAIDEDGPPEGVDDADDIPCDEAIELAADIDDFSPEAPGGEFATEGQVQFRGAFAGGLALLQAVAGILLLRKRSRGFRTFALVTAAFGVLTGAMIGMVVAIVVVYCLVFSREARIMFPPGEGGGFLRPRPPRA